MTSDEDRPGGIVNWWWNLSLRWKSALINLVPLLLLLPCLAAVVWLNVDREDLRREARHYGDLVTEVSTVRQALVDGETAVRGYLATGDLVFLEPFEGVDVGFAVALEEMRELEPDLDDELDAVERDGRVLIDTVTAMVVAGPPGDPEELVDAKRMMDDLRVKLDDVQQQLEAQQESSRDAIDLRTRWIFVALFGGMLVAAVSAFIGVIGFARSIASRVQLVGDAAARVLSGEPIGHIDTPADDEIGQLVRQLNSAAEMLIGHNDILAASRDEAIAATRAKDEFLSRMSHELRTPLSAILGFGQLLQMEDLRDDDRDSVDHIVKAGRHLLNLINDLLDISRISAGHMALSMEPIEVGHLTAEVLALLRPQAGERNIDVRSSVEPGVMVFGDNQRLRQVLLNLVSNAIKYNRDGGRVEVETEDRDGVIRITVTDTGRGLPTEGRERLFQPFERLDAAATGIEGTGVGLALSKSLVEAMGGTIGVTSETGVGSTFWVELDTPAYPTPLAAAVTGPAPSVGAPPSTGDHTVLYVEDNLTNVSVMERLMRDRPERLEVVLQGGMAVELAQRLRPSLIILDLHLPDVPGETVLRALLAHPDTANIPVAILSADVTAGSTRRVLDLGAHAFLPKPIDVQEVLALLDETSRLHELAARSR